MMNDGLRPRVRTPRALQVSLGRRCRPGDRHQATEACRCIVELSRAAQLGSDATFDHARAEAPPLRYLHRWPAGLAPFEHETLPPILFGGLPGDLDAAVRHGQRTKI